MNNIKTARTNAGLSQKEIAITLGVSVPTVSDWESGKKFPSGKNLVKLAQTLHTTTDHLLGCAETKEQPTPVSESGPLYPPEYDLLNPEDKELVDSMIRSLAKKKSTD